MLYEIIYIHNFVFVLHFESNFGFVKADAPHGIWWHFYQAYKPLIYGEWHTANYIYTYYYLFTLYTTYR